MRACAQLECYARGPCVRDRSRSSLLVFVLWAGLCLVFVLSTQQRSMCAFLLVRDLDRSPVIASRSFGCSQQDLGVRVVVASYVRCGAVVVVVGKTQRSVRVVVVVVWSVGGTADWGGWRCVGRVFGCGARWGSSFFSDVDSECPANNNGAPHRVAASRVCWKVKGDQCYGHWVHFGCPQ
jgi:hypothetical protein